jgi:hypothetical protein
VCVHPCSIPAFPSFIPRVWQFLDRWGLINHIAASSPGGGAPEQGVAVGALVLPSQRGDLAVQRHQQQVGLVLGREL